MKTRNGKRHARALQHGFMPYEADVLAKVPLTTPYVRSLYKERREEYEAYAKDHSEAEWADYIRKRYESKGWLTAGKFDIIYDAWKMIRDYEHRFRARFPQYESPWEKRTRSRGNFIAKAERTIARQKGQLAYGR